MADLQTSAGAFQHYVRQKKAMLQSKACEGMSATSAQKMSRESLIKDFTKAAQQLQVQRRQGDDTEFPKEFAFIGEAYTPCVEPLSGLEPILLQDLQLETHHRGRVLFVKTICPSVRIVSIMSGIEDETGQVDRLAIYNLLLSVSTETALPEGTLLAIKEPYYKVTADKGANPIVRVDHPSDIVYLPPYHPLVPIALRAGVFNSDAMQLKELGNKAVADIFWHKANEYYSTALNFVASGHDDLRRDLYVNRALVLLELDRYELAVVDALASLEIKPAISEEAKALNVKALECAGDGSYKMGEFSKAAEYFKRTLKLSPGIPNVKDRYDRTCQRIQEQDGVFDFVAMEKSATEQHKHLDHASFLRNARITQLGSYGRGLVATKLFEPGDVIFVEKAFFTAFRDDFNQDNPMLMPIDAVRNFGGTYVHHFWGVVDKMLWNKKKATRYQALFAGEHFPPGAKAVVLDGKVVVDTCRIESATDLNSFGCPKVKSSDVEGANDTFGSIGIFLHASNANHECIPNASRSFLGDMMIVRADKQIKAGEQIFLSYCSPNLDYDVRTEELKTYGFACTCILCLAQMKEDVTAKQTRHLLCEEAKIFVRSNGKWRQKNAPPSVRQRAKALMEQIEDTYDEELFERLPRTGCLALDRWLCETGSNCSAREGFDMARKTLRDAGYFVRVLKESVDIDRTYALSGQDAFQAARYGLEVASRMEQSGISTAFRNLMEEIHVNITADVAGGATL